MRRRAPTVLLFRQWSVPMVCAGSCAASRWRRRLQLRSWPAFLVVGASYAILVTAVSCKLAWHRTAGHVARSGGMSATGEFVPAGTSASASARAAYCVLIWKRSHRPESVRRTRVGAVMANARGVWPGYDRDRHPRSSRGCQRRTPLSGVDAPVADVNRPLVELVRDIVVRGRGRRRWRHRRGRVDR